MEIPSKPTWKNIERPKDYPQLSGNIETEIAIIGGGLAGVITAYLLAKEGRQVVLLEKKHIGSGATEYTTAFLTHDIDTDLADLVSMFGEDKAKAVWESHASAIDLIEKIVEEEKIDCEFTRCNIYSYATDTKEVEYLKEEKDIANRLGFKVEFSTDNNLGFINQGYAVLPKQAKYHPLKFLFRLAEIAEQKGVKIFENTEAKDIKEQDGGLKIITDKGEISAQKLVMATYRPFINPLQLLFKKGMYVSYVFEAELPKGKIPEGLYQDMKNPYQYFRIDPQENFDRMIIGGQDHREEIPIDEDKNFNALEEYLSSLLGSKDYKIVRKWSGPILEPSDGLALIGEYDDNKFVATAFSGNGMTYSGISGMILADRIAGRANAWAELYDPKRIPSLKQLFKKGKDYTEELFGGAMKNIFQPSS
jgi:glycine/D-amino acid oxidase-like deaminating enzyme